VDKLTYAALEATLLAYLKQEYEAIPIVRMMQQSKDQIGLRARTIARGLAASNLKVEVIDGESVVGGGAAPSAVVADQSSGGRRQRPPRRRVACASAKRGSAHRRSR